MEQNIQAGEYVEAFITSTNRWQVGIVTSYRYEDDRRLVTVEFPAIGRHEIPDADLSWERGTTWLCRMELPAWQARRVTAPDTIGTESAQLAS